jgi:predicted amidohydrolase YtcJ
VACSRSQARPSHDARDQRAGPTLRVVNAVVWTGDPSRPWAEAIAVDGSRILAVGTTAEIETRASAGEVIDARGQLLVPGFIDSHVHFLEGGFRLASVQLRDARTRTELVSRLRAFAATVPEGSWITGGDWDHTLWGGEPPRRNWIDAVTPNHPVWINRLDGHMALAKSAALRAAGVTRDTPAIEGGEIVRNAKGEPTGLLKDNAMSLVEQEVPPPSTAQKDAALAAAMQHVAAHYGGSAATGSSRRRRRSKASRSSRRWRRGASPMIAAAPPRRCASRCRRPVAAARARRGRCRPTSPCCGPSSRLTPR